MNPKIACTLWIALALGCTGCLRKERVQILYLEPDGAVTWTVVDTLVRSDEKDPAEAANEERAWLRAVDRIEHPTAEALRMLGAAWVTARIERSERPYAAITEAWFPSIDGPLESLLRGFGLEADAELWNDGDGMRLRLTYREVEGAQPEETEQAAALELADDDERFRLVLTKGAFVAAEGFRLEQDDTVAILEPEEREDGNGALELAWR